MCRWPADLFTHHKPAGGSTLTQHLRRTASSPEKRLTRKNDRVLITFRSKARFNKAAFFEI